MVPNDHVRLVGSVFFLWLKKKTGGEAEDKAAAKPPLACSSWIPNVTVDRSAIHIGLRFDDPDWPNLSSSTSLQGPVRL